MEHWSGHYSAEPSPTHSSPIAHLLGADNGYTYICQNDISDIDHFFFFNSPLCKSKSKENVRGVVKTDRVVKCPASQRRCVGETLAEFLLLIIAAVDIFV